MYSQLPIAWRSATQRKILALLQSGLSFVTCEKFSRRAFGPILVEAVCSLGIAGLGDLTGKASGVLMSAAVGRPWSLF